MRREREKPLDRKWVIRPATVRDIPEIISLLNRVYGYWGDSQTWIWKFNNIPNNTFMTSAVAEHNGHVIGHYGIIPVRIIHQGEIFRGMQAVDAAVSPEFRRQGIFLALGNFVLKNAIDTGAYFAYAFPGLASLQVNHELGFHPILFKPETALIIQPVKFFLEAIFSLPSLMREYWLWQYRKDRSPETIKRLTQIRHSVLWMISWLSAPVWHRSISVDSVEVKSVDQFDHTFDRFSERQISDTAIGLVKDSSYLTWRYAECPDRIYQILVALEDGDMIGYVILHITKGKSSICECEILNGKEHAVYALLRQVKSIAWQSGSRVIEAWVTEQNPIYIAMKKVGFISQRRVQQWAAKWESLSSILYQIILYTNHLPVNIQQQLDVDAMYWPISMGDSDLV